MQNTQRLKQNTTVNQQGAVLVIGLMLLLGITLLSVSGIQSVVFNQRMATNAFQVEREFHLAESAGGYAVKQVDWRNSAFKYYESKPNIGLLQEPNVYYGITHLTVGETSPPPVKAGVLVRPIQPLNMSAGIGSGVQSWVVESYGNAGVESGGRTIVQGFNVIGAGGNG